MADTVEVKHIYPPNYDFNPEYYGGNGHRRIIVQLLGSSDGTGETDVTKIDLSNYITSQGITPVRTSIEYIKWAIHGMTVLLEWDRAPNGVIARLNAGVAPGSDSGELNWKSAGGNTDPDDDPLTTGNILLTSSNVDAGDSYDITMCIRFKDK